ncbi:hypothetical protein RB653_006554 [Dictyostelium firmibasis]|uniref:Cytochrome P450 n=1 Tax=Dictyostelium firmibasis TaxID=79012 RepID=A0AAN7YQ45_9MYCE
MGIVFVLIFLTVFLYILKNTRRARIINSKIPGPIGLPYIGNLLSLRGEVHLKFDEWYKKYGPIYSIRMGNIDTVVLTEYSTLKKAFVDNAYSFTDRYQLKSRIQINGAKDIVNQNGKKHEILKKVILSEITSTKVKKYENNIIGEAGRLISFFDKHAEDGRPFSISGYVYLYAVNIIIRFLFGDELCWENVDLAKNFLNGLFSFADEGTVLSDFITIPFYKHNKRYFELYDLLFKEIKNFIEMYLKIKKDKIKNGLYNPEEDNSIISKLIIEYEKGNITWDCLSHTCADIIGAGSFTTANAIFCAIIEMANNPSIQNKTHNDVLSGLNNYEDIILNHSKYRSNFPYLSMVIKETFRKYPSVLLGVPHMTTDDVIVDGYKIAAGTQVFQNIYSSQMSEKVFPSPNEFIPERFNKACDKEVNSNLLLFGIGVRDCIGKSLSESEIFTILATLIYRYEFINPSQSPLKNVESLGVILNIPETKIILKKKLTRNGNFNK